MAWCCHVLREIDIKGALNLRLQKEHRLTSPTLHLPRLLQGKTVTKIRCRRRRERERESETMSKRQDDLDLLLSFQDGVLETPLGFYFPFARPWKLIKNKWLIY